MAYDKELNPSQAKEKILTLIMSEKGVGRSEAEKMFVDAHIPETKWPDIAGGKVSLDSFLGKKKPY